MWPTSSPTWPPHSCPHPMTSSIRTQPSPPTSWSSQPSLLFPGVPQGHLPPQQSHRDHVPPGYQFSTPPLLEPAIQHPDPTFYLQSSHHHPTLQPSFGPPPPAEPVQHVEHHHETFSDMIRRYPSRPLWASTGYTEPSWTSSPPNIQPPAPQPSPPQPPSTQPQSPPVPPTSTPAPPPSSNSAPPTSPPPPPATPTRAESPPTRRRRDATINRTLKTYLNQFTSSLQAAVQSTLQPLTIPPTTSTTPQPQDPPHQSAVQPRPHQSESQRHSTPLPRRRHARRSRSRSLQRSRHHSGHRKPSFRSQREPSRRRRRSPSPRQTSHRRDHVPTSHHKHRRTPQCGTTTLSQTNAQTTNFVQAFFQIFTTANCLPAKCGSPTSCPRRKAGNQTHTQQGSNLSSSTLHGRAFDSVTTTGSCSPRPFSVTKRSLQPCSSRARRRHFWFRWRPIKTDPRLLEIQQLVWGIEMGCQRSY